MYIDSLPLGWSSVTLDQIVNEINPGFPSGKWKRDGSDGVPHLRPMNISPEGEIDLENLKYAFKEGYDALKKGDILFNNTNSPKWLGKTTYIKKDTNWAYSNHMTRIRLRDEFNPAFFSYYMHFLMVNGYYQMHCRHHVNQSSVNTSFLRQLLLPIPPFNEQVRIVGRVEELFSQLDAAVRSLKTAQTQLEQYRQTCLEYAIYGKLTEKWRKEHNPPSSKPLLLDTINKISLNWRQTHSTKKYTKPFDPEIDNLPLIPDSWTWATWDQISEWVTYGFTRPMPHVEKGVSIITGKNVFEFSIDFENVHYTPITSYNELSDKDKPKIGDILVTKDGSIGRAAVVNTDLDFCINQSVAVIWLRNCAFNKRYLLSVIESPYTQRIIHSKSRGVAIKHLSITDFRKMPIPVPTLEEQEIIANKLEYMIEYVSRSKYEINKQIQNNVFLKQSILTKAFEGQLVPQDPRDEPASVLFERIKAQKTKQRKLK